MNFLSHRYSLFPWLVFVNKKISSEIWKTHKKLSFLHKIQIKRCNVRVFTAQHVLIALRRCIIYFMKWLNSKQSYVSLTEQFFERFRFLHWISNLRINSYSNIQQQQQESRRKKKHWSKLQITFVCNFIQYWYSCRNDYKVICWFEQKCWFFTTNSSSLTW